MPTIAEQIVTALADLGVRNIWGVVGDALNPVTDAIRRENRLEWIGTRHEEVAAFAAGAQAQHTGIIGVCMGTVGPGSIHLLNGLYDAKKSRVPVLAVCGQVPLAELGSDYFQEVDNDALFRDVAEFCQTVTSPAQMPRLLEQAVQAAYAGPGVAVLTLPGDVGSMDAPKGSRPHIDIRPAVLVPHEDDVARAAELIDAAGTVTMLVGADGPDAEGQAGAGTREPVPDRPERPDRQPGLPRGVRRRGPAAHDRHRLPLPGVAAGRDPHRAGGHPGPAHRAARPGRRRPRRRRRAERRGAAG